MPALGVAHFNYFADLIRGESNRVNNVSVRLLSCYCGGFYAEVLSWLLLVCCYVASCIQQLCCFVVSFLLY